MKRSLLLFAMLQLTPACGRRQDPASRPSETELSPRLQTASGGLQNPVCQDSQNKTTIYTAKEARALMGLGINMGNVFDRGSNDNSFASTKALLDLYREKKNWLCSHSCDVDV